MEFSVMQPKLFLLRLLTPCLHCYIIGVPGNDILELFGEMFFDYCKESGYDKILQALGSTTIEFLQNLDALHDHLSSIYPRMRAPSFRCTEREEDGATILHYYSERDGLEHIVIGIVRAVAKGLYNSSVEVEILQRKSEECDHTQFVIIDRLKVLDHYNTH